MIQDNGCLENTIKIESDDLRLARDLASEYCKRYSSIVDYYSTKSFSEGQLSKYSRYELKISGKVGSKEIAMLIKKLQIDLETLKEEEEPKT